MWLFVALSFVFGAIVGSFLNVLTLRLPHGHSVQGRSGCPRCGHVLAPLDLIPIVSYLLLRGKCRYCSAPIAYRYWLLEVVTGIAFAVATYVWLPDAAADWLWLGFLYVTLSVCIVTFVIDLEHFLILDTVTGFGSLFALGFLVARALVQHMPLGPLLISRMAGVACGLVFFWLLWRLSRGRLLGFGDVKFTVFIGVVLGFPLVVPGLLFSFWLGALYAIPLLIAKQKRLQSAVPFGTFLVPALLLALVIGDEVIAWYGAMTGLW